MNWVEFVGYAASVLVAVSLMMSSIARLRALNLLGAVAFAIYGWLVGAYPVMAVNGFIALVNVVFLLKMQPGRSEAFELLAINRLDNRYLQRFLEFHSTDIQEIFPQFGIHHLKTPRVAFILRDMAPVGLVICDQTDEETLTVKLDYVIPSHRDFRCAQYFYQSWRDVIKGVGISRFLAKGEVDTHRSYLKKMGFRPDEAIGPDWYFRPT